ncbi:VTT domain-containing protein [Ferrovum sp. PN-J185]|uniref:VTT domain-containing protein n=1 Tax=Ferrovum sp. PN-J185 TaxID=1356306 RepID=UPI000792F7D6|nr:VTT domain-containing protein [Ferrovum sp. PN-J185]KXW55211.1 inner membrane protein YqjA [Ferrovum sp. PN-J185]MCC6069338.1 VTT domain-containing protein [Ferrovum sp. PN-J185]
MISHLFSYIAHLDSHLIDASSTYGPAVYGILFLIIFCETGLVIFPFLPGDSLLFVAGAVAAMGSANSHGLRLPDLLLVLSLAAFLGNAVNFQIGRFIGPKVFHWEKSRWFNPHHLASAHAFYEKHGGKTVVISRFVPLLRTFAPFVAGVGDMTHQRFYLFNAIGAVLWVSSLLVAGYYFGNVPFIKGHLTLVILSIVAVTLIPIMYAGLKARMHMKKK